ncbi:hypothetical protein AOG27_21045, partial [Pseudoalteromonas lipolytica]
MGQLLDIQAAGGDIGGHQHLQVTGLEGGQRLGARGLALVAMDRHGRNLLLGELFGQAVCAVLGTREDQYLMPVVLGDQVGQQLALLLAVDAIDRLVDELGGGVAAGDLDHLGIVEQLVRQRLDLVGEGRREQQVLALLGQYPQDLLDVVN